MCWYHSYLLQPCYSGGRFTLVDLAGSEGSRDVMEHSRKLMSETAFISQSLGVLKECIRQLSIRALAPNSQVRS